MIKVIPLCLLMGVSMIVSGQSFEERVELFAYDNVPFVVKEFGSERRGSVVIKDIAFSGIAGNDIEAYLVLPEGEGPFAGILWGHWLGHHTSDRNQYLDEAVAMAELGVISLLINTMWSDPDWYSSRNLDEDFLSSIKQVVEFRRSMDFLLSQNVNKDRIAFVGHDYSGMYGSIAAGLDNKASTHVFVAVTSSLFDWAFFVNQPEDKVAYVQKNAVFELTEYVGKIKGSIFCQFSLTDPFISKTDGNVFYNAITSENKLRKRYAAGHDMLGTDIRKDRNEWLARELNLNR